MTKIVGALADPRDQESADQLSPRLSTSPRIMCVLILATMLRSYLVTEPFTDMHAWREASTAMMAENLYRGGSILYPAINWDGHGLGYNGRELQTVTLVAASLYPLFGQRDWVGRAVAIAFGVWGVFALYQLILQVWDAEVALLGATVMALLPGSVFVDREFLPDPGMVSLVTTGCWAFSGFLQTRQVKLLAVAGTVGALGFMTKLTGLIVVLPISYMAATNLEPRTLRLVAIAGIATIVPVIAYYLWALHLATTYPPHHFAGAQGFIWNNHITDWLHERYFLAQLYEIVRDMWTAPRIVLVVIGILAATPRRLGVLKSPLFFHYWLLGGGALYYGIGASHLVGQGYNLHVLEPAAAALAGHGLRVSAGSVQRLANRRVAVAFAAAVLCWVAARGHRTLVHGYYRYYSEDAVDLVTCPP